MSDNSELATRVSGKAHHRDAVPSLSEHGHAIMSCVLGCLGDQVLPDL